MIRRNLALTALLAVFAIGTGLAAAASHFADVPTRDHLRQNPFAAQRDATAAGALLYRDHCAQCHKADARGDRKHPSLRSPQIGAATDGDLEWFLRQGDLRHGMPSWSSLPQAQRWQIIAYLRTLQ
jgi:mono/diheme cytochrome c family protein